MKQLPIGIASFERIRSNGLLYVDKTEHLWRLVNASSPYVFLNRPRRFGKSLFVDTLACYFEGRKELFEGLWIDGKETEWKRYPVLRFNMSGWETAEMLEGYLANECNSFAHAYGVDLPQGHPATLLYLTLQQVSSAAQMPIVVLVDEYDAPLYATFGNAAEHEKITALYRTFFTQLKANENSLRFVFLTGVSRFSNVSVFSLFNNLTNIGAMPEYNDVCGITEPEMDKYLTCHIQTMADDAGVSFAQMRHRLKAFYDGYHFSPKKMDDIYNPFSVLKALYSKSLCCFWLASGGTRAIDSFLSKSVVEQTDWDNLSISLRILSEVDYASGDVAVLMYQTGYLTIKEIKGERAYLGLPNFEVKTAFYQSILPYYLSKPERDIYTEYDMLNEQLNRQSVTEALGTLQRLVMGAPYLTRRSTEADYRNLIAALLYAAGLNVTSERAMHTGVVDIVAEGDTIIMVMELKLNTNGGIAAAEQQLISKHYVAPFEGGQKPVCQLAVEVDADGKGITVWKVIDN